MGDRHEDAIGSVAEEAIKLVYALTAQRTADGSAASSEFEGEHQHDHPSTCQWCPICQLINMIRDNPEAVENVTASAVAFAQSVKSLLDVATNPPPKDHT